MSKLSLCSRNSGEIELNTNNEKNTNSYVNDTKPGYTFFQNVKYYFKEFCSEGTIHGIKYVGEDRTLVEKIWWLISIAISLYLCITLILATYDKWENAPVIVSFATKETPIWQIPFPAVTLCPEIKSRPSVFNYTKYLFMKKKGIKLDPEIEKKFGYLSLICTHHPGFNYESDSKIAGEDVFDFFHEVQPNFYEDISECKYMGEEYDCADLFKPILTDEGVCYVFNLLDRHALFRDFVVQYKDYHSFPESNWTLEHGYPPSVGKETYPKRTLLAGASYALELKLTTYVEDMDYYCGSSVQGYRVQISNPSGMPRVKEQHFPLPLDELAIAAIGPDMMTTSDAIKNYNPARRNCYFPSERYLKYFKVYSQQNCEIECKSNYTEHKCGCVDFYMPRNTSTPICNAGTNKCMQEASNELMFEGLDKMLRKLNGETNLYQENNWLNCDCLPICTSMNYIVENSQSGWDWKKKYQNEESNNTRERHMSYFQVFFKGNQFITSDRNELFGPTDFLANFGGLLGLFIGFSLLSLIEFVYYLTLRIICNITMFGSRNWAGRRPQ